MEKFYIAVERIGDVEFKFHLERLTSVEQAENLLYNFIYINEIPQLVVTNDDNILAKYKAAITEHDFRAMCGRPHSKYQITLNPIENKFLSANIFDYFELIMSWQIRSAHTIFKTKYLDEILDYEIFDRWELDNIFRYTKMPNRYRSIDKSKDEIFNFINIKLATLFDLNILFNVDIMLIGLPSNIRFNWEYIDGMLRYFDPISKLRFYILPSLLKEIKSAEPKSNIAIRINTRIDRELYIEYIANSFYLFDEYIPQSLFDNSSENDLPF